MHHPDVANYFALLGVTYQKLKQSNNAIKAYQQALSLDSYHINSYIHLSELLYTDFKPQALAMSAMALRLAPDDIGAIMCNIQLLVNEEELEEAKNLAQRGRQLHPTSNRLITIQSQIELLQGNIAQSKKIIEQLDAHQGVDPFAMLAKLRLQGGNEESGINAGEAAALITFVADKHGDNTTMSIACFALSNYYKTLKDPAEDIKYLHLANKYRRELTAYQHDYKQTQKQCQFKITTYNKTFFIDNPANKSEQSAPIFIIGMPRSGSSLTEQIISAHPDVIGLGEMPFMPQAIQAAFDLHPNLLPSEDGQAHSMTALYPEIASHYLQAVNQHSAVNGQRFTDKMLANFQQLQFIHKSFPRAKFIHIRRHPLDNCLGIYRQLFNSSLLNFSYDLDAIADNYIAYSRLMAHWHQVMPGVILDVNYEELVSDTENIAKRIIQYCDLPWDASCLRFYNNKGAVKTASAVQAKQQIYTTALTAHKRYDQYLQGLREKLSTAGIVL